MNHHSRNKKIKKLILRPHPIWNPKKMTKIKGTKKIARKRAINRMKNSKNINNSTKQIFAAVVQMD